MLSLAIFLALACQEGEVDRIMLRFKQRIPQAKDEAQWKRLLAATRAELERFLKEKPKDKDAHRAAWHVAESLLSEGALEPALERLTAFLKDHPDSEHAPSARFAKGEVLLQREEDAAARAAFEEFTKLHPKDDRALFARLYAAVTLQNERRYDEAAEVLAAARETHKDRRESWGAVMQLAVVRHAQEKNKEARATLEEVVRTCPDREAVELARRHLSAYLKVGDPAPGFAERDLKGGEFSLEKHRGKVVVLHFFDAGLTTAATEADFLKRAKGAFKPEELQILGVSVNPDAKDLSLFVSEMKVDWPIHLDPKGYDGKLARLYDARLLPSLTVIDRKGRIRFFNLAHRDLRNGIAKLLEEK